jgi:uncharacterized membrane protein
MTAALVGALVLVASGVVAGVLFSVALGVVPAFLALPPDRYIEVHKLVGRRYDRVMPPLVVTCTVLDLVLAVTADGGPRRALLILAAALGAGVAAVSQLGNVPINRRVKRLPAGGPPPDWPDPRARWRALHLVRTVLALLALAANAGALMLAR